MKRETKYWYIWSNEHMAWWKSNRRGYSKDKNHAGVYSTEEAYKIVKGANEYQYADNVPNEAMIPMYEFKHIDDHECCDGECNHDDCCGKVEANCPLTR